VGYGEIYPKSHLGRFVGIFSCFWGFFVISMMVVTMGSIVKFSLEEESSYNMFKRLEYSDKIREKALLALGSAFKKKMMYRRDPSNTENIDKQTHILERKLKVF
jgi:hypothetical protein